MDTDNESITESIGESTATIIRDPKTKEITGVNLSGQVRNRVKQ